MQAVYVPADDLTDPAPAGLPIHIAEDPLSAVAEGTGKALQELDFFTNVTDAED